MNSFIGLFQNAILLLALSVVYDALANYSHVNKRIRDVITGVLVGCVAIAVMLTPWEMSPGVFFDSRWILMCISGLYFGPIPTLVAALMAVTLRLFQGGDGIYVGSMVIICSSLIGLYWRHWHHKTGRDITLVSLYLMGIAVQLTVLFLMLFMPSAMRFAIISQLFIPLLTIFPIVTVLMGILLREQRNKEATKLELIENKNLLDRERSLLKELLDGIPDLIFYKSKEGVYQGCNQAFADFVGKPYSEIVGKTDFDLFDKDVAEFFREKDKHILDTLCARTNEETVLYPDKTPALLETLKTPLLGERGQIYGVVGISRDITERNRLYEHIRINENIYRHVLKTAIDGFWIITPDGVIQDVNTAYEKMSGYTHQELLNMSIDKLDFYENTTQVLQHIEHIKNEVHHRFESKHRRKDGSIFDVEINVTFWPEEGGKIFVFIKDITERHIAETLLQASEARFRHIFEHTPMMAVQGYDRHHRVVFWNQASEDLFGYQADKALGRSMEALIVPEHRREQVRVQLERWFEQKQASDPGETILQTAEGKSIHVYSSQVVFERSDGEKELYCVQMDLTALKKAEDQVVTLSQAIEQSPVSILLTDTQGLIEYVNAEFEKVTGYSREEVQGKSTSMLKSGNTPLGKYQELWSLLKEGRSWKGEFQNSKKDGTVFWESAHIAPLTNSVGAITHYLAVKQDITQNKVQEERILHQAHFDSLTDLPNRFLSLDRLEQMIKEAKRFKAQVAVFFLDLDDFKKVNDTLGHQVGDELLKDAAKRLSGAVREADIVGRLGGDEFIVMMNLKQGTSAITQVAKNLLEAFRAPFKLDERELVSTVSVGVSVYPDDGRTPAELLRQADAAMYYSKAEGRNTFNFYTESMNKDVARRLLIEEQLRSALDNHELEVFYQPVISFTDRKLVGAEALLRWHNPVLGHITPDEFIPIAEQTGLIVTIGRFVLEQALSQSAQWRSDYVPDFTIAVNLSPRQFRDEQLVPQIISLMESTRTLPSQIELEITEGVLMSGHAAVDDMLSSIHSLGISISMDDFGTGYSSLSYLRSYPFNILKIDKSFISDIEVDQGDLELVAAAISMAHGLGLKVIAEGVETEQQYQLLLALKCDFAQGYLFGRPLPHNEFQALLNQRLYL